MTAFALPAGEFALAIRRASIAVDRKAPIPVLLCLRIEAVANAVKVGGSNLFLHAAVLAPAVVTAQGVVAVDQAQLHGIVSRLPPEKTVKCSVSDSHLVLKCGGSKYQLTLWEHSAFPAMAKPGKDVPLTMKAQPLSRLLSAAGVSMLLDDQRPHLSGVALVWGNPAVSANATDSMRLSRITAEYTGKSAGKVFLPYLAALAIGKFCESLDAATDVNVLASGTHVHCWSLTAGLACKLVGEVTMDYERLIPLVEIVRNAATVDRAALIAAIARLRVSSENAAVTFAWEPVDDKLVLTVATPGGTGREVVRGTMIGSGNVLLSSVLLTDLLASCDGETATLRVRDADSPVLLCDTDATSAQGLVCVVMPCKIPGTGT